MDNEVNWKWAGLSVETKAVRLGTRAYVYVRECVGLSASDEEKGSKYGLKRGGEKQI